MTNRDYVMELDNERLAELIFSKKEEICDSMKICCCRNCLKCIKNWLEMERHPKVERGQMRRESYEDCFWLILYVNEENGIHDWCIGLDEYGHASKLAVDVVRTWILWDEEKEKNDDDVEKFLERLLNNL